MGETAAEGGTRRGGRWLAFAILLSLVQGILLAHTAWDKSDTNDEPYYLATSFVQWNEVRFSHACDAPALP